MLYLSVFCSVDIHGVRSDLYLLRSPGEKLVEMGLPVELLELN